MTQRLDIIIFGATGFTGSSTIVHLVNILKGENLQLKWGIAGRSTDKLKNALNQAAERTGDSFENIPIIIADVNDGPSLIKMTERTRVIINTTGPYRFYLEPVIKACLETKTHHVDVSGESDVNQAYQLKYHEVALKKGVYLITACGVGSIPVDLGVIFLQNNFTGTLNSVESYSIIREEGGPYPGPIGHVGSWESALLCTAHPIQALKTRSQLLSTLGTPKLRPTLRNRLVHWNKSIKQWAVPLPEPDQTNVIVSQRHLYQLYNQRPVQIQTYTGLEKLFYVFLIAMFGFIAILFAQFSFTRKLLFKYPALFSYGYITKEGPSLEKQEHTICETILVGEGWSERLAEPTDQFKTKPNKTITAKVSGKNPAYGTTCVCLVSSAITILLEKDKMPNNGGYYPPGAAFSRTSLIKRLHKNGVTFEITTE